MSYKEAMREAVERGRATEHEAYEHVRESVADAVDNTRKKSKEQALIEGEHAHR